MKEISRNKMISACGARKDNEVEKMCKMNVVMNKLVLGNRELGWEIWDGRQVAEFTSKQLKDIIRAGKQKVCGLRIGENGELEPDKEGFFTTNMMVHSHIGSWRSMEEESMANLLYVCIGSHEESGKTVYDCISSRFEQAKISENDMRAYLKIGIVSGGAKLDGEKIVLASMEPEKTAEQKAEKTAEPKPAEPKKAEKTAEQKVTEKKPEPAATEKKLPEKK